MFLSRMSVTILA